MRNWNMVLRAMLCAAPIVVLPACAGLTPILERTIASGNTPNVADILSDLEKNDAQIETFRAAGTFTLESPEFDAIRKFRRGRIMFRRPKALYAQGNHRITNMTLFKLISVDKEFLIEFPTNKDESYYRLEGEEFENVPFSVSPSDIVREMFLPESWGDLRRREARITAFDRERQVATVELGPRNRPRRRIEVTQVNPESPVWVITRNELLEPDGRRIAITLSDDYRAIDGIYFPSTINVFFPTESTRMIFELRNIRMNTEIPDEVFNIRERIRELNLD
ncbi:MAG: hypothetical protein IIB38_10595 [Candidatus Hydrogenedentes bacterium]|nr:hypothetical protein [Candidatus Hydrogenedentota bacterium]